MDFDRSKENIQPLRGGRNVAQLGMALQAQSSEELRGQLNQQKEYVFFLENLFVWCADRGTFSESSRGRSGPTRGTIRSICGTSTSAGWSRATRSRGTRGIWCHCWRLVWQSMRMTRGTRTTGVFAGCGLSM